MRGKLFPFALFALFLATVPAVGADRSITDQIYLGPAISAHCSELNLRRSVLNQSVQAVQSANEALESCSAGGCSSEKRNSLTSTAKLAGDESRWASARVRLFSTWNIGLNAKTQVNHYPMVDFALGDKYHFNDYPIPWEWHKINTPYESLKSEFPTEIVTHYTSTEPTEPVPNFAKINTRPVVGEDPALLLKIDPNPFGPLEYWLTGDIDKVCDTLKSTGGTLFVITDGEKGKKSGIPEFKLIFEFATERKNSTFSLYLRDLLQPALTELLGLSAPLNEAYEKYFPRYCPASNEYANDSSERSIEEFKTGIGKLRQAISGLKGEWPTDFIAMSEFYPIELAPVGDFTYGALALRMKSVGELVFERSKDSYYQRYDEQPHQPSWTLTVVAIQDAQGNWVFVCDRDKRHWEAAQQ